LELYEGQRAAGAFDPVLLARTGPPMAPPRTPGGTPFVRIGADPNQLFIYTEGEYDHLFGVARPRGLVARDFSRFLREISPDIVHFQHTLFLGYDLLTATRSTLPDVPILYTLHEYLPICFRFGQMVRTQNEEPCEEESSRRCHECFPELSPATFFRRKRFIQSHLANVDVFLAPSRFLRDRYVDWGLPPEKIVYEEYGRVSIGAVEERSASDPRRRLGFFGQLTHFKGANVLLEAMRLLAERKVDVRLRLHGANLDLAPKSDQRQFWELLRRAGSVTFVGAYEHTELPRLMAEVDWVVVPSIWWENSPLVIQEAFASGRPVICSGIGGMAEKVDDGVSGLHFRVGDPVDLADIIERAVETPGLWDELRRGASAVYAMETHVAFLNDLYWSLIEARAGRALAGREVVVHG
jgi:glycosyltransferase involved in cell wall biosynthesis